MFLGHYAVALAAKRAAPRTSLGTLIFAAQFLDELWPILVLAGVERVRVVPGLMEASPLDFEYYPWSHSLLMALVWALLVAGVYWLVQRYRRGAVIVGLALLSHWFLDMPMHRPDLPVYPGSGVVAGAGLWNSVVATLVIEFGLLAAGLFIYLRTTRARDRIGSWGLYAMIGLLVAFYAMSFGPPPPDGRTIAIGALFLLLFVPWGWWVDRHRELRTMARPTATSDASRSPGFSM